MRILVTGACGFIGSHLVEQLVKKNHNVTAFVFYNSRSSNGWLDSLDYKILKEIKIVAGDIRDGEFLFRTTKKIDVIFHLAALIGIPYSYLAPKSYLNTNIMGTFNVLDASLKNKVSQVVITSTSEVYGSAQYIPINEKHPLNAQSPYAASKIGADQLALSYNKSFGLPLTILRPFNTFGPRQSARAIIPSIISQIKKNNNLIKIGNLTPTRDFTFVDDTVLAFIRTISNKKAFGEIINIGNNFEISIADILKIFKNEFNFKFKIKIDKIRIRNKDSEVNRLYSSNIKAKKLLNWKPTYNGRDGFIRGLKKTIEWFQNPNNLKFYNSEIYNI